MPSSDLTGTPSRSLSPAKTRIERHRAEELRWPAMLEAWKRLERQGWELTLLEEIATGDVVELGVLEHGAEPAPDRTGQYELQL